MIKATEAQDELLTILIEECAEVIQAATKIKRFGFDSTNMEENPSTNFIALSKELGDLTAMIELAIEHDVACELTIYRTVLEKFRKLEIYSTHLRGNSK